MGCYSHSSNSTFERDAAKARTPQLYVMPFFHRGVVSTKPISDNGNYGLYRN
jgi:hypothetical protein